MSQVKSTMTINRSGQFHIETFGQNHCGTSDQFDVRYHINVVASQQLDQRGFLFDQLNIQSFFDSIEKTELSCEQLTQACLTQLVSHILVENPTCQIYRMTLTLSPAPYAASMEATLDGDQVPLNKPADLPSLQNLPKTKNKVHDPAHKHEPSHTHYKYKE